MEIAIGETFFTAVNRLSAQDRGRILTFITKFQENYKQPGLSLERVHRAKSNHIWSGRVSDDLRAIIYMKGEHAILLYVDHHDEAYNWANRYVVEPHPKVGMVQIVEIPKTTESPVASSKHQPACMFDRYKDDYLLSLGVPELWLPTIRQIRTEDELFEVTEKLPLYVSERLLDLAAGKLPTPPTPVSPTAPFNESEATNLMIVRSKDELRFLLDAPLAKWIAFLHPSQKKLVHNKFKGAVKVTGSAGTGKTVVAMHRAKYLASQGDRVLVTSFVQTLCRNIERNLQLFCTPEELKQITVSHVHKLAEDLIKEAGESWQPVDDQNIAEMLKQLSSSNCPLDPENLLAEWQSVIEAQGITSWDQYRGASRAGRGRALTIKDRKVVWTIIEQLQQRLAECGKVSFSGLCRRATELIKIGKVKSPFDAVIVDEMQDLRPQELLMLSSLAQHDKLMLVGDGGQRIYAGKVVLKSLGIDVRGRSHVLRLNYRTTEQIRRFADSLLSPEVDDLDGGLESRIETRSLLSGPEPQCKGFNSREEQYNFVVAQIHQVLRQGRTLDEIAVFARQSKMLAQIENFLKRAAIPCYLLNKENFPNEPAVHLATMHRAKGLEFKIVFVIDVDYETLPSASVLKKKTDEQLQADFIEQEQQLLYVSVTRARDIVFVTWAGEPSRFLKMK